MKGYKDSTKTVYLTGKSPGPKGAARAAQTMKSFKTGAPVKKFAEGGSVYVGPDRNKVQPGTPKVTTASIKKAFDDTDSYNKNLRDAESAERGGRWVDATSADVRAKGDKSGYSWAYPRDAKGRPKVPDTKKMYREAEDSADAAAKYRTDQKPIPMKERRDLQYDGGELPARGMKKPPQYAPVMKKANGGRVMVRSRDPMIKC